MELRTPNIPGRSISRVEERSERNGNLIANIGDDAGLDTASEAVSGTPGAALWSAILAVGTGTDFAGYSSFAWDEEHDTGAVCTADDRKLSDRNELIVRGPGG